MSYCCKPVSSSFFTNQDKQDQLFDIFRLSHILKNDLSIFIRKIFILNPYFGKYNFSDKFLLLEFIKQFEANFEQHEFVPRSDKTFNQISPFTKKELAETSQSIATLYINRLNQAKKRVKMYVYESIEITRYKEDVIKKNKVIHKKNEIKTRKKVKKENSSIYKFLLYMNLDAIENKSLNLEEIKKKKPNDIEFYKKVEIYLEKLYRNEKLMERFLKIMRGKIEKVFKTVNVIEFKSGSYRKLVITATNKNQKNHIPTRHSYIEKDEENKKFKYFYKFKTGRKEILDNGKKVDEIIRIPLNVNKKFHGESLSKLDLNKDVYVKRREDGKIIIGMLLKDQIEYVYEEGSVYAGIDLNLRDNFMSIAVKNTETEDKKFKVVDHNREEDENLILKYKDIRNLQEDNPQLYKKELVKLIRIKEFQIKKLISETISWLKEQGVKNIVMEDLRFKNNKSRRKLSTVDEKITWFESFYRMASVKVWVREQCRKHGIVVHYTPTEYTSQECSRCHHIEKENRKGDKFVCLNCGMERNSDENASENIMNRVLIENVSLGLHKKTLLNGGVYELNSKRLGHEKTKKLVEELYDQYVEVQFSIIHA